MCSPSSNRFSRRKSGAGAGGSSASSSSRSSPRPYRLASGTPLARRNPCSPKVTSSHRALSRPSQAISMYMPHRPCITRARSGSRSTQCQAYSSSRSSMFAGSMPAGGSYSHQSMPSHWAMRFVNDNGVDCTSVSAAIRTRSIMPGDSRSNTWAARASMFRSSRFSYSSGR